MINNYKTLLIFIIIDFILPILFFTFFGYPSPSAEAELLIIPIIFILNFLFAMVLGVLRITKLLKTNIYKTFIINAFVGCLIYLIVDFSWHYILDKINYRRMIFQVEKQKYELELIYKYSTFEIFEKHDGYGTGPIMEGTFQIKGDSVLLNYKDDIMLVYKDSLAGFKNYPKLVLNNE